MSAPAFARVKEFIKKAIGSDWAELTCCISCDAEERCLRKEEAAGSNPAQSPFLPELELLLAIHPVAAVTIRLVL